ncbi:hypothetical protein [Zavarzinella formosa]|nr:hypothetical protein [Zavarzinella formosa]
MVWFPISLTGDEQQIVNAEREFHPEAMSAAKCSSCGCRIAS